MPTLIYIIHCNLSNQQHTYCFMCVPNSVLQILFKLCIGSFLLVIFLKILKIEKNGNFTLNSNIFLLTQWIINFSGISFLILEEYHWHKKKASGVLKQKATFFRLFCSHLEMCKLGKETLINQNNRVWIFNCSEYWSLELGLSQLLLHSVNSGSASDLQNSRNEI